MERKAVYTNMLPRVEIEGGLAFLVVDGNGHTVCTTVHIFEQFLEEGRRVALEWHAGQAEPIPLSERRRRKKKRR